LVYWVGGSDTQLAAVVSVEQVLYPRVDVVVPQSGAVAVQPLAVGGYPADHPLGCCVLGVLVLLERFEELGVPDPVLDERLAELKRPVSIVPPLLPPTFRVTEVVPDFGVEAHNVSSLPSWQT
jgi:hypothetical protein